MTKENIPENRWLVIINPNAGKRKGEKEWPEIHSLLNGAGFEFIYEFTTHRNHAAALAEHHVKRGFRKIIVVGGDGTMNEVINGIFRQDRFKTTEIIIGMIMVGTGNDWGRMYNLKEDYSQAIRDIVAQKLYIQDAGLVTYFDDAGEHERFFINSAGMGYDALVVRMTNLDKDRGRGGPLSYLVNLVKGLFRYSPAGVEIGVDGRSVYKGNIFSMSIGICKYSGGGMMQLPNAIPDDGLLDVTIFTKISK